MILGVRVGLAGITGSGGSSVVSGILLTLRRRDWEGVDVCSGGSVSLFSDLMLGRRIGRCGTMGSSIDSIDGFRVGLAGIIGVSSSFVFCDFCDGRRGRGGSSLGSIDLVLDGLCGITGTSVSP